MNLKSKSFPQLLHSMDLCVWHKFWAFALNRYVIAYSIPRVGVIFSGWFVIQEVSLRCADLSDIFLTCNLTWTVEKNIVHLEDSNFCNFIISFWSTCPKCQPKFGLLTFLFSHCLERKFSFRRRRNCLKSEDLNLHSIPAFLGWPPSVVWSLSPS